MDPSNESVRSQVTPSIVPHSTDDASTCQRCGRPAEPGQQICSSCLAHQQRPCPVALGTSTSDSDDNHSVASGSLSASDEHTNRDNQAVFAAGFFQQVPNPQSSQNNQPATDNEDEDEDLVSGVFATTVTGSDSSSQSSNRTTNNLPNNPSNSNLNHGANPSNSNLNHRDNNPSNSNLNHGGNNPSNSNLNHRDNNPSNSNLNHGDNPSNGNLNHGANNPSNSNFNHGNSNSSDSNLNHGSNNPSYSNFNHGNNNPSNSNLNHRANNPSNSNLDHGGNNPSNSNLNHGGNNPSNSNLNHRDNNPSNSNLNRRSSSSSEDPAFKLPNPPAVRTTAPTIAELQQKIRSLQRENEILKATITTHDFVHATTIDYEFTDFTEESKWYDDMRRSPPLNFKSSLHGYCYSFSVGISRKQKKQKQCLEVYCIPLAEGAGVARDFIAKAVKVTVLNRKPGKGKSFEVASKMFLNQCLHGNERMTGEGHSLLTDKDLSGGDFVVNNTLVVRAELLF